MPWVAAVLRFWLLVADTCLGCAATSGRTCPGSSDVSVAAPASPLARLAQETLVNLPRLLAYCQRSLRLPSLRISFLPEQRVLIAIQGVHLQ
jgi:hypothetical protein